MWLSMEAKGSKVWFALENYLNLHVFCLIF
jgi:hypothetical protein